MSKALMLKIKTRAELVQEFNYPVFRVEKAEPSLSASSYKSLHRLAAVEPDQLILISGQRYRCAQGAKCVFGQAQAPYSVVYREWLRPGDWVGLSFSKPPFSSKPLKLPDNSRASFENSQNLDYRDPSEVLQVEVFAPNTLGNDQSFKLLENLKKIEQKRELLFKFASFQKKVREFFHQRQFLEVNSPTLVISPGTEVHLDFFETEFIVGHQKQRLYLTPSPELSLKKYLAHGYGNLFEIKSCFRNGEKSPIHRPEFWMLEWYREGGTLEEIREDCVALVEFLRQRSEPLPVKVSSWREQFQKHLGIELTPNLDREQLEWVCRREGLRIPQGVSADDLFHLLVIERLEPKFDSEALTFIGDYPPSQAALARISPEGWAQRFEMFWRGMELANAYQELNHPGVQRERAFADNAARVRSGKRAMPLDEEFFTALQMGLPPSSGIALGLERLFLALEGQADLNILRLL